MNLTNNIDCDKEMLTKEEIEEFIRKLEERLKTMENEVKTYVIDRFENNIAVCENRATCEIINIDRSDLPSNIKEGDIVEYRNGEYSKNEEVQEEIEDRIQRKMDDLWN